MRFEIINSIINTLGRSEYSVDSRIPSINMAIIIKDKFFQIIRGLFIRFFFKKVKGIIFLGRRCRLRHLNKVHTGKTLFIGDNVEINALSLNGIKIGDNVSIHRNTIIDCTGGIRFIGDGLTIGNNVGFSPNCYIQVRGSVRIGNNVIFGPYVKIFSESHNHADPEKFINEQGENRIGVNIEDGVWIGAGATILDGVTIGSNSIVAASSVVNRNIPAYSIVAGIPAKIIKKRKSND